MSELSKRKYVLGFAFVKDDHYNDVVVVLIRKKKPEWQAGKLNGVGGKIEAEDNEMPEVAMAREFREETGVTIEPSSWDLFADIEQIHGECFVYRTWLTVEQFAAVKTVEEEAIEKIVVGELNQFERMSNLDYLIPMALDKTLSESYLYYDKQA